MKLIIQSKQDFLDNHQALQEHLLDQIGKDNQFIFISSKDKSYKIEEIRNFISKLNNKQTGMVGNLFYILLNGDSLPPITQNALLKTLEDSSYSIGILVKNIDSLLPTIKSRCQVIQLRVTSDELKVDKTELDFGKLAKMERVDAISTLENAIASLSNEKILNSLQFQDAINKLNANCKVEAVMIELEWKLKVQN